jgi:hypothetical protein
MKRLMTLAVLIATASACVKNDDDKGSQAQAAIEALPTSETLTIAVPASAQKVGDVAVSYLLTRTIADTLNGSAAVVLGLAKAISEFPVTSIEGSKLIWGPWSETLKPGEYRMTAQLTGDGDWSWAIEGRKKGSSAAFQAVVSGVATPGRPHRGSGSFTFDCDLALAIDPYDLEHSPVTVVLDAEHLAPMPDGSEAAQTFHYEYSAAANGSGTLSFMTYGDSLDLGTKWENTEYVSQWTAAGAGRTDIAVHGGDLGDTRVTAVECWDTSFLQSYYTDSQNWLPTVGSPSACPF